MNLNARARSRWQRAQCVGFSINPNLCVCVGTGRHLTSQHARAPDKTQKPHITCECVCAYCSHYAVHGVKTNEHRSMGTNYILLFVGLGGRARERGRDHTYGFECSARAYVCEPKINKRLRCRGGGGDGVLTVSGIRSRVSVVDDKARTRLAVKYSRCRAVADRLVGR